MENKNSLNCSVVEKSNRPKGKRQENPERLNRKPKKQIGNQQNLEYSEDILAVTTYYTKIVLFGIADLQTKFLNSNLYKILFKTTQPAHLLTAMAVIFLSALLSTEKTSGAAPKSPFVSLLYLGSFSAHFGVQIWMTFVSGLSLYFSLPRHTFGNVQQVLFPKYFLLNAVLSLLTLVTFVRSHKNELDNLEVIVQVAGMAICFMIELIVRLYLAPPLLRLMLLKNKIEVEAGVGNEVGKMDPGKLKSCPHFIAIFKSFRMVHMTIAILNIVAMASTMFHLFYLSQKLSLL